MSPAEGGVFRVTAGLQQRFGSTRCFDTPLAESAIVGVSIGLAIRGYRPVPEIQFDGFVYPALDQIISHLAKYRSRTHGEITLPVTLRVPSFGGIGAADRHSDSIETYLVHTAGIQVVSPATPNDAYWLLRHSIDTDDPVIFLEPKRRYWNKGVVDPGHGRSTHRPGDCAPSGRRRDRGDLRGPGRCGDGGRRFGSRGRRRVGRSHRPAIVVAPRLRHDRVVGHHGPSVAW